jgi:hypothetical protein
MYLSLGSAILIIVVHWLCGAIPVTGRKARPSVPALEKIASKRLTDGSPAHRFSTLLQELGTIVRNTCRRKNASIGENTFTIDTTPNTKRREALALIKAIKM